MWNNYYGYYSPAMGRRRREYDDNLCLYYEKEKVYYDNRYPECFREALRDLECKKVDVALVNGDTLENATLDAVERDYIAVVKPDCGSICLIPMDKINHVCLSDDLANDLWGKRVNIEDRKNRYHR